jgi:hypothetical protein
MNHTTQLQLIEEVQAVFPPELVAGMWFNPVDDRSFDELHARSLAVFSPVYLPIFERHGDLYCLHLVPQRPWQSCAWVELPHDESDPILVATRLAYLPAGLITPPHWGQERIDEIWAAIEELALAIPGAVPVHKADFLREGPGSISFLRAKYDPEDGAAQTGRALSEAADATTEDDGLARLESVLARLPDDHYAQAVVAIVRSVLEREGAAALARRALAHEYAWGWHHRDLFYLGGTTTTAMLEQVRAIAVPAIDDADPFSACRNSSFENAQGAAALKTVAERLRAAGDERGALDQLRNGALIAGVYGRLTRAWCEALAEQAHRVAPGDPAALLAEHAATVIHLEA